nr:D-alanine--poly(phosphoribitol) ligase subunit DltC [Secundilactobacillus collinoides]
MSNEQTVLSVLQELTATDLSGQMTTNLFTSGLLDSMATVQMVMELNEQCSINIPISEFDRNQWDTPEKNRGESD